MKNEHIRRPGRRGTALFALLLSVILLLGGCGLQMSGLATSAGGSRAQQSTEENSDTYANTQFQLADVPAYDGESSVTVHDDTPYFTAAQLEDTTSYETYGDLDSLGRCTGAIACIGTDLMPTEKRGAIGDVRPTGWHTVKYDGIDGVYLYNRCHLIGYQLTAENANVKNLITGTRYLNVEGMLPYEDEVAEYVEDTGNHVLYRVTPVFDGQNLLASGVLMEAESVEDGGKGIRYCVYCYNVQPGITINYANGDSSGPAFTGTETASDNKTQNQISDEQTFVQPDTEKQTGQSSTKGTYILNTNTRKFHRPDCPSVKKISDANRQEFTGSRQQLVDDGYAPCKNCKP